MSTATHILLTLVKRFHTESIITDLTVKLIKVCLAMHFANVKRLATKRKSITGNSKLDTEDTIFKSKNLALEEFIYKIT